MLNNKQDIQFWLEEHNIANFVINNDLTVNVNDNVDLGSKDLSEIEVQFNVVNGYFDCSFNELTSLKGCPKVVGGYFACDGNQLTTLDHAPKNIVGHFLCNRNPIVHLDNFHSQFTEKFHHKGNPIKWLEEYYINNDQEELELTYDGLKKALTHGKLNSLIPHKNESIQKKKI